MISRNQEHELIMISIYDALIYSEMDEVFSLEDIMEGVFMLEYDDIPLFSKEIVIKSLTNINDIKQVYQVNMPKWNFDRLNAVERAILLMSYTHKKVIEDSQKKVIIDVAVRLAKKYLDKDDYKFVNAILDRTL